MILLTDGWTKVSGSGRTGDYPGGRLSASVRAQAAVDLGCGVLPVGNGDAADSGLMRPITDLGSRPHLHAEGSIEEYSDRSEAIFNALGGQRPAGLIG